MDLVRKKTWKIHRNHQFLDILHTSFTSSRNDLYGLTDLISGLKLQKILAAESWKVLFFLGMTNLGAKLDLKFLKCKLFLFLRKQARWKSTMLYKLI